MAVEQKILRRLICEGCLKPLTNFIEKTTYEIRMEHPHVSYKGKDFCVECNPRKKRSPVEQKNIPSKKRSMKKIKSNKIKSNVSTKQTKH